MRALLIEFSLVIALFLWAWRRQIRDRALARRVRRSRQLEFGLEEEEEEEPRGSMKP